MWHIPADSVFMIPRENVIVLSEDEYFELREAADRWYRIEDELRRNLARPYDAPPPGSRAWDEDELDN